MNIGAELTLQIARLVQERSNPPRSAARWLLVPVGDQLTWPAARDTLAALPKPLWVAPLSEPGWLGIWRPETFEAQTRSRFNHHLENQVQYYREKLTAFGMSDDDTVCFEPATPVLRLTAGEYLQWASEYVFGAGVTLGRVPDSNACRILIMPPGGGAPPMGLQPDPYGPAT